MKEKRKSGICVEETFLFWTLTSEDLKEVLLK